MAAFSGRCAASTAAAAAHAASLLGASPDRLADIVHAVVAHALAADTGPYSGNRFPEDGSREEYNLIVKNTFLEAVSVKDLGSPRAHSDAAVHRYSMATPPHSPRQGGAQCLWQPGPESSPSPARGLDVSRITLDNQELEKSAVETTSHHQVEGRNLLAAKWRAHEDQLLDAAVELFKERCTKEAEAQRCLASISFEVLTRDLEHFPKRILMNQTFLVGGWGGASAEQWFYATHGFTKNYNPATPVLFAEMLESMMNNFIKNVTLLGFNTCARDAGTWRVAVTWEVCVPAVDYSGTLRPLHLHRPPEPPGLQDPQAMKDAIGRVEEKIAELLQHEKDTDPFFGVRISRDTNGVTFHGKVVDIKIGAESMDRFYIIRYDDGDREDLTAVEVAAAAENAEDFLLGTDLTIRS